MINVQVDVLHSQILQARVNHIRDVLLPADSRLDFLLCARKKLRRYRNVLPPCKIPERVPHELLARAALIGNRGIKEIDAELQSPPDDFPRVLLVQRPAVLPPRRLRNNAGGAGSRRCYGISQWKSVNNSSVRSLSTARMAAVI